MRNVNLLPIALIALGFVFFSCQSKDFKEPGIAKQPTRRTAMSYRSNYQKTWDAVSQAASKYPILISKKESGTLVTDWIKGKSDRLYSGYGETRIPYTIRYKLFIKVKPDGKGTSVRISGKEQYFSDSVTSGIDFSGSLYQWLDTKSSTLKEAAFLDEVAELIEPPK